MKIALLAGAFCLLLTPCLADEAKPSNEDLQKQVAALTQNATMLNEQIQQLQAVAAALKQQREAAADQAAMSASQVQILQLRLQQTQTPKTSGDQK